MEIGPGRDISSITNFFLGSILNFLPLVFCRFNRPIRPFILLNIGLSYVIQNKWIEMFPLVEHYIAKQRMEVRFSIE